MRRMTVAALVLASLFLASLAIALPAAAQSPPPQAYQGLTALAIPYANGPMRLEHVPEVWLQFAGSEPRRFGMDTGSTGIVVSAEHYIPAAGDVDGGPGQLTYNSSGRVLHGTYWTTDVGIMSGRTQPTATARVQVLRVDRITCLARARNCEPREHPRGVAFMGIGFDRHAAQGTQPTAQRNPFVALSALASGAPAASVRPGYIVTRDAVHLGMTPELTRDFAFVKLQPKEPRPGELPDWNAAHPHRLGRRRRGDRHQSGRYRHQLHVPLAARRHGAAVRTNRARGHEDLDLAARPDRPNAAYSFTVGDWNTPLQPERVVVVHDPGTFVNTGRQFLQGFDYLYDAAGGYVGYAWTGRAGSANGSVATGR